MRQGARARMFLIVLVSASGQAMAAEANDTSPKNPPGEPRVVGRLSPRIQWVLRAGHARAREWALSEECRALFAPYDTTPSTALSRALYSRPFFPPEEKTCERRRAAAFTNVGPGRTVLCPAFADLSLFEAAAILLHEALHDAGQPEWPSDPEAPTSKQIHGLVLEHCIDARPDETPRIASTRPGQR